MKSRMVSSAGGVRTLVVVFDAGDEVMQGLQGVSAREHLTAASLTAIGAFERVTLG